MGNIERWTVRYDHGKARPVVWNCPPFFRHDASEVELARASEVESLRQQLEGAVEALEAIRDYDPFQGGPIAPRESPTTVAMRRIADVALYRLGRQYEASPAHPRTQHTSKEDPNV